MSESDESGEGVRISPKSLSRRESASPGPVSSKKRTADESAEAVREKPKRKKKKEGREIDDGTFDLEAGINTVFANMDSRLLADFVAQRLKRFEGDLSTVELDDRQIPEKAFKDTSMWSMQRNLESLPAYLENFSKSKDKAIDLSNAPKSQGSPHTLVVTGAGLRAADLTRSLRTFQTKDATVAKLFAKHIKLKDAEKFVKNTRINIAVGTPSRLSDLVNAAALSLDKLERIVVDSSHIDQKKRGIFDMREIFLPLIAFLNHPDIKSRYPAQKVELLFY